MNHSLRLAALALAFGAAAAARAAVGDLALAPAASAPRGASPVRPPASGDAQARAQCETAVGNSIREVRGKLVQGLQFDDDTRAQAGDGAHVDVKGAGHYRRGGGGPVAFRYSCVFDLASGGTSGVLFHDTDAGPAATLPVWKADLSRLSPEACEGAVASSLQSTHPRAAGIVFDGDTRKLEQGSQGGTALAGTGRVTRAPGMQASAFKYRCEFDASGRIVGARAAD